MLLFVVMQIEYSGGYMMGYTGNGIDQLDEYFLNYEQPRNTNQASQVFDQIFIPFISWCSLAAFFAL